MRFGKPRNGRQNTVIDIAPLVDIVFQLLIFFMLAASFSRNPVLDISLPKASAKPKVQPKGAVTVYILAEGRPDRYRIDDRVVTEPQILEILRGRRAADPAAVLLIQADERVPHGDVVRLMSVAQEAGFTRQGIVAATPAPSGGGGGPAPGGGP